MAELPPCRGKVLFCSWKVKQGCYSGLGGLLGSDEEQGSAPVLLAFLLQYLQKWRILPGERVPGQATFIWNKQDSGWHFTMNPPAATYKAKGMETAVFDHGSFHLVCHQEECPGTGTPSGADISSEGLMRLGDVSQLPEPRAHPCQQLCGGVWGPLGA